MPEAEQSGFAGFAECLAVLSDAKRYAALMADLRQRLAAAVEAMAAVANEAGAMELEAKAFADGHEVEQEDAALTARLAAAADKRRNLGPRRDRLAHLRERWRCHDEPDSVRKGFQAPLLGDPLSKARLAHGTVLDQANSVPPTRIVNADVSDIAFPPHTTVTRSVPAGTGD
jgi:hypothetical protein